MRMMSRHTFAGGRGLLTCLSDLYMNTGIKLCSQAEAVELKPEAQSNITTNNGNITQIRS